MSIDVFACPSRRGMECKCKPVCVVCGFGPHASVHGPRYGEEPGGEPYDHEYQTEDSSNTEKEER